MTSGGTVKGSEGSASAPRKARAPFVPGMGGASGAPPFILPGEHFAAALVFWALGGLGLVWVAPELASGLFPLPRVIAVAHLFTLGWITLSILGALYQFLPVALGVPVRWERMGHLTFAMYVPGLVIFAYGLVAGISGALVLGAFAFGTALLLFIANLAATLWRAPERGLTWWSLVVAGYSLLLTVVLGLMLAVNLRTGFLGANRFVGVGVHMHVAIYGWVLMVVVGVAHRLLPMFLLSHGASQWPGRVAAALIGASAILISVLYHTGFSWALGLPAALASAGVVAFLAQAALFYRHSRKPRLDAGMRLAAAALGFLALGVAIGPFAYAGGAAAPRLAVAYGATLVVGAFGLFVAAHHYKILPFLVWFHRFGPLAGRERVPQVADLYDSRLAHLVAVLLGAGALGLVVAVLAGAPGPARAAAAVFAAGAALQAGQLFHVLRRRPG